MARRGIIAECVPRAGQTMLVPLVDAFGAETAHRGRAGGHARRDSSVETQRVLLPRPGRAVAAERARRIAPFGGIPVGIKELEPVGGWPQTEGSLVFKDRIATQTSTVVERLLGTRRRYARRAHDGQRVRGAQRQRHEAQRGHAQPLAARQDGRRIIGRHRGRGRRAGSFRSLPAATAAARFASPPATRGCSG